MKTTKVIQYHPNPYINALMVATLTGDKKVRADLATVLPEAIRARKDEILAESDVRTAERNARTREEALAILKERQKNEK